MPACKLTPEVEVDILNLVAAGNTLIHAGRAAGTTAATVKRWVELGKKGREPYASFVAKLDVAEAKAVTESVKAVQSAARSDWRAAKFHLEYLARRGASAQNVSAQLEEILQVVEDVLGAAEAKKVLRAIVDRSGEAETGSAGTALRLVSS